jgi:hypothetical protein
MQNTLRDLRGAFNDHLQELRNELMSRTATQQQAAHVERIVRDVAVQHENDLASVGVQEQPSMASAGVSPMTSDAASSMATSVSGGSSPRPPSNNDNAGWGDINVPNIPQVPIQPNAAPLSSQVSYNNPLFDDDDDAFGDPLDAQSRVSGSYNASLVGSGSGRSSTSDGGFGGVASNGSRQSSEHGAESRVYGEEERAVQRDNESGANGGYDRAVEHAHELYQQYNNTTSRGEQRRIGQRLRAIANTWGIDTSGQVKTIMRRFVNRPI